jgi:hypothetical protein
VAFFAGIFATWLFMYGLIPIFQGPIAVAMGGVDLSWLAGALTSAAVYAVLGPIVAAKYDAAVAAPKIPAPRARIAADAADPTSAASPAGASGAPEVIA